MYPQLKVAFSRYHTNAIASLISKVIYLDSALNLVIRSSIMSIENSSLSLDKSRFSINSQRHQSNQENLLKGAVQQSSAARHK